MFDYFFKRSGSAKEPAPAAIEQREAVVAPQPKDKEVALQKAGSLTGDEAAAVEFILQCQFADARLIAAEHVHSRDMLERVLPQMRKADRRVAKLMQARLDALAVARQREQQAQQCVDTAHKLLAEALLLPNQVAELDRAWQLVGTPPSNMQQAYDVARATLRGRLEAQAQLQRTVIDGTTALRDLQNRASSMAQDEIATALASIDSQVDTATRSAEAAALPKHVLTEFAAQRQQLQAVCDSLTEILRSLAARQELLQRWEESADTLRVEKIDAAWSALKALPDDAAAQALQERFTQLRQRVATVTKPVEEKPKAAPVKEKERAAKTDIGESLEAMEKALQDGLVRAAVEIDKQLRAKEGIRLSHEQNAHLTRLRSELHHLQGWARWGGNVSREELLRAAEEMQGQTQSPAELAKKVGGLRDRWKSLDISSGPATKELWERFDAACTTAYAPAAAHFKRLSDERQANMHKAEALVAEVREHAQASAAADADWKSIAAFCTRTEQAWHKLGTIDRKEKKRLDAEFADSLQLLKAPLVSQQQAEIKLREDMIAETQELNPTDRATPDAVRALQERWQHHAKTMPLERKDEQALWQKFRSACDALFAKRKEVAAVADADRKHHLGEKEALCQKLEAAVNEPVTVINALMREAKDAWNKIGHVPRAQENQIDGRLHKALAALQAQVDAAKRVAAENEKNALVNKLRLCMAVEQALAEQTDAEPANTEQWQALPALSNDVERILRARFDKGVKSLQAQDAAYRATLEGNRAALLHSLLRLEILVGLESPAELSRERLQMQVEVLQTTLKNGAVTNKRDLLKDLCKLAATVDAQTTQRVEALVGRLNALA
jgi:hypothetical protein